MNILSLVKTVDLVYDYLPSIQKQTKNNINFKKLQNKEPVNALLIGSLESSSEGVTDLKLSEDIGLPISVFPSRFVH